MGFLDGLFTGISGVSALAGLFGANDEAAQARAQQQAAINQYSQAADADYQNMLGNNQRTLLGATGLGGDALQTYGRGMGSALSGAGIYNSSATAGALANSQRTTDASLANLSAQNAYDAAHLHSQNQQNIANMQLGLGNQQMNYARQDQTGAANGLQSWLGGLTQNMLQQNGSKAIEGYHAPAMNGTAGQGIMNLSQPYMQDMTAGTGLGGAAGTPYGYTVPQTPRPAQYSLKDMFSQPYF